MRDMKEKYGAEVQSFRYAFVLPSHLPGWDEPLPEPAARPSLPALASASGTTSAGKSPRYIEVKPRAV